MPTKTITDKDLLAELKKSHLEEMQKNHFTNLIPYMTDKDKAKLMDLIKESHKVQKIVEESDAKYQEELAKLNKNLDQEMTKLKKEMVNYAFSEYKKLEEKESEEELGKIESEISNM